MTDDPLEAFIASLPFRLDPFQRQAMEALDQGKSVLVAAPTGTGKTVIAEFGVYLARRAGLKAIYTTPIKALSNQKYRDFRAVYGDEVGLVTGDVVVNQQGSVLVMTTEVLRNMLLTAPRDLLDVRCVVLDEVHYMADRERGSTWEECIILLPAAVQLVCLSATVPNAVEIADWMRSLGRDVALIRHDERAIPLEHWYYFDGELHRVLDARGRRHRTFPGVGGELRQASPGDDRREIRRAPSPLEVVRALRQQNLLPAIYFVFSRRAAEEAAGLCAGLRLLSPEEGLRVRAEAERQLAGLPRADHDIPQIQFTLWLIERGVAFHHAGLLPMLKSLVEELFAAGRLRLICATDTLSLGINVPARAVVISEMTKFDGEERRLITPNEYHQMAGRAGRRGIDVAGTAVTVYSPWTSFEETLRIATAPLLPLRSAFRPGYSTFANLWRGPRDEEAVAAVMAASLREFQLDADIRRLRRRREARASELAALPAGCLIGEADVLEAYERDLHRWRRSRSLLHRLEGRVEGARAAAAEAHRLLSPEQARRALRGFKGGELLYHARHGWGVFVDRREGVARVLFPSGCQTLRQYEEVAYLPNPPLAVAVPPAEGADWSAVAPQLAELELPDAAGAVAAAAARAEAEAQAVAASSLARLARLAPEVQAAQAAVEASPCHRCPELPRHRALNRERARMQAALRELDRELAEAEEMRRERARATVRSLRKVLERLGYLEEGRPTHKLERLRRVYDTNALTLCELVERRTLEGLPPEELAEAISWFAFDREPRGARWTRLSPRLAWTQEEVLLAHAEVMHAEANEGLELSVPLVPPPGAPVLRWAEGWAFADVAQISGLAEGDLMLLIFKTIDLAGQIRKALEHSDPQHPLLEPLAAVRAALHRGVVAHALARIVAPDAAAEDEEAAPTPGRALPWQPRPLGERRGRGQWFGGRGRTYGERGPDEDERPRRAGGRERDHQAPAGERGGRKGRGRSPQSDRPRNPVPPAWRKGRRK